LKSTNHNDAMVIEVNIAGWVMERSWLTMEARQTSYS
jgi:hypothetical protein